MIFPTSSHPLPSEGTMSLWHQMHKIYCFLQIWLQTKFKLHVASILAKVQNLKMWQIIINNYPPFLMFFKCLDTRGCVYPPERYQLPDGAGHIALMVAQTHDGRGLADSDHSCVTACSHAPDTHTLYEQNKSITLSSTYGYHGALQLQGHKVIRMNLVALITINIC